jgi:putative Mn2+ efflux pump MntP
MSGAELFLIAVGLSMDAFAVSVVKGMSVDKVKLKHGLICALYFGLFQGLMPLLGYMGGVKFSHLITNYDHWVAFILLLLIGISMIKESRDAAEVNADFSPGVMFPLAIATSIDALAVGISLAFLKTSIIGAVALITLVTMVLSFIGVKIGSLFGSKFKSRAEMVGGFILILIGSKILIEHLGLI